MFENILKELKIKFSQFKTLVISNSLSNEQAQQYAKELMFASNIVKSSFVKNETAFSAAQLMKIKSFQKDIEEFKNKFPKFFIEDEQHSKMIADFKEHLPEKIKTDCAENIETDI